MASCLGVECLPLLTHPFIEFNGPIADAVETSGVYCDVPFMQLESAARLKKVGGEQVDFKRRSMLRNRWQVQDSSKISDIFVVANA